MKTNDPRHGEYRGAVQHWMDSEPLCEPCAFAAYRYGKRRKIELATTGVKRRVPSWRVMRRVEALQALGYSMQDIADEAGMTFAAAWNLGRRQPDVYRDNFDKIARAYDRLSMKPPPHGRYVTRTRNRARRRGYAPPLAWDDIDDPNETPNGIRSDREETGGIDEVAVQRALGGDFTAATTLEERAEVVRRWYDAGRSRNELARLAGWKPERYYRREVAA